MNKQFLLEVLKDTIDIFTLFIKASLFILPAVIAILLLLWGIVSLFVSPIIGIVLLIFSPIMMFISVFFSKLFGEI
jgi:hypothetical protein